MTEHSHGREGVQGGEGSWDDCGDAIIVERQQTHRAEACEGGVVHTGDLVAPQHPARTHTHMDARGGQNWTVRIQMVKVTEYLNF